MVDYRSLGKYAATLKGKKPDPNILAGIVSMPDIVSKSDHKAKTIYVNEKKTSTDLISLTKTGKTRFYVIIGIFLLIVIYLEGNIFKKLLTKNWYK